MELRVIQPRPAVSRRASGRTIWSRSPPSSRSDLSSPPPSFLSSSLPPPLAAGRPTHDYLLRHTPLNSRCTRVGAGRVRVRLGSGAGVVPQLDVATAERAGRRHPHVRAILHRRLVLQRTRTQAVVRRALLPTHPAGHSAARLLVHNGAQLRAEPLKLPLPLLEHRSAVLSVGRRTFSSPRRRSPCLSPQRAVQLMMMWLRLRSSPPSARPSPLSLVLGSAQSWYTSEKASLSLQTCTCWRTLVTAPPRLDRPLFPSRRCKALLGHEWVRCCAAGGVRGKIVRNRAIVPSNM